jgi:hypothetical protein
MTKYHHMTIHSHTDIMNSHHPILEVTVLLDEIGKQKTGILRRFLLLVVTMYFLETDNVYMV